MSSALRQPIPTRMAAPKPFLATKGARKLTPVVQSESDSSDTGHSASGSQNNDSDSDSASLIRSDHDMKRDAIRAIRPILVTKSARKVQFDVRSDSDSDGATVRAAPSQHHAQQRHLAQAESSRPLQHANQKNKNKNKNDQESREPTSSHLDVTDDNATKLFQCCSCHRAQSERWGKRISRKERNNFGRRRVPRLSTSSSSLGKPSQNSSYSKKNKRRQWFYHNDGVGVQERHGDGTSHHEPGRSGHVVDSHRPHKHNATRPAAGKPQVAMKSTLKSVPRPRSPSPEWESEGEYDLDYSARDGNVVLGDLTEDGVISSASENSDGEVSGDTEPSPILLDALEQISSSVVRLHKMRRLPFLLRNLRNGFQDRCRILGVDTESRPLPRASISVIYSCSSANGASSRGPRTTTAKGSMNDWLCPLCDLHTKFCNSSMLDKHLAWDHSSVTIHWDRHYTALKISLTIPDSRSELDTVTVRQVSVRESSISTSEVSSNSRHEESSESIYSDKKPLVRISSTPSGIASESGTDSASTIPTSVDEDLKPKLDPSECSNPAGLDAWSRGSPAARTKTQDGIGPSLTPPYLPESDANGDVYYSCRPGGERLFDFLNTLSLKPYGVLKWVIIDREEELFELDDILDEDKVMQALWFRWIFLHRNEFVANHFDGTKAFVEDNLEPIKQGAGLLALRTWLLVLLVNNFLLPTEIATLMRYYQELAGLQPQH